MGRAWVKRLLLIVLIVSLVAAALVGATILVLGSAGDLEARILVTVLLLGFFSLTGLCAAVRFGRGLAWLGWVGVAVSVAGLAYSEVLVWAIEIDSFDVLKPALALGVAATALAYVSLVLLARGRYRSVNAVVWLTVALVLAIAAALIAVIITEIEPTEVATRALGAVAILAALGTILAPLLRKFLSLGEAGPPTAATRGRAGRHRPKAPDRETEIKGV